jgi:hypothetical protein
MAVEALNEPDLQQPMQLSTSPQSGDCLHLHSHHTVAGGLLLPTNARHLIEPDPNSFSSDYSEMAEPIREHLANVQIICREDLAMGNTVGPGAGLPLPSASAGVPSGLERGLDETDESYNRRVRVTNYLSLAQEFAALKKADSRALPFDLHRSSNLSKAECSSSSDEGDDDDDSDLDEADDGRSGNTATAESVSQSQVHSMEPKTYHPLPGRDGDQKSTSKCSNSKPCIPDVVASSNQSETNALPSGRCSITSALPSSAPQSSATASAQHRSGVVKCSGHDANDGSKTSSSDMTNKGNVVPETSVAEEFEVYTIETALPHVEWERLEQQFSKSSEEEKKRRVGLLSDSL